VAGRYQPLADDVTIAGDVRPNPSSAVDSEDKAKRAFGKLRFASASAEALGGKTAELNALATANQRASPGIRGLLACHYPSA